MWHVKLLLLNVAGNIDIVDVFKRLTLKTVLCVVPTCWPNTACILPTLQLLVVFFSCHMSSHVLLIADMSDSMVSYGHVNSEKKPRQQPDANSENGNNKMIICRGGETTTRRQSSLQVLTKRVSIIAMYKWPPSKQLIYW